MDRQTDRDRQTETKTETERKRRKGKNDGAKATFVSHFDNALAQIFSLEQILGNSSI